MFAGRFWFLLLTSFAARIAACTSTSKRALCKARRLLPFLSQHTKWSPKGSNGSPHCRHPGKVHPSGSKGKLSHHQRRTLHSASLMLVRMARQGSTGIQLLAMGHPETASGPCRVLCPHGQDGNVALSPLAPPTSVGRHGQKRQMQGVMGASSTRPGAQSGVQADCMGLDGWQEVWRVMSEGIFRHPHSLPAEHL